MHHRFLRIGLAIFLVLVVHLSAGTVTSIWPTSAPNDTTITLKIYGVNFSGEPTIKLFNGVDSVIATNVTVVDSNYITCDVNLSNLNTGYYSLMESDATTDTLKTCFSVTQRNTNPSYHTSEIIYDIAGAAMKMAIGDGNNNGKFELYVSSWGNRMYELWWDDQWNVETLFVNGADIFPDVAIGDGDNDGYNEVYGANNDFHLYQFTWVGSYWTAIDMGASSTYMKRVAVGDVIKNGTFQVYSTDDAGYIYQFTYNGSAFNMDTVINVGSGVQGICIGDGDNNGKVEIYVPSGSGNVYQISWDDTIWTIDTLGSASNVMREIAIGDGDNDGNLEIYACSNDDSVYQFKWNGTSWEKSTVGSGTNDMMDVEVGDADNDGYNEVVAGGADYNVRMFKWNGSSWNDTVLYNMGSDVWGVAIGDADGNGINEVFATGGDGNVLCYRFVPPPDILIKDITNPPQRTIPAGPYSVKAIIKNNGYDTTNIPVYTLVTDTITGDTVLYDFLTIPSLKFQEETLVTFVGTADLSIEGTYEIMVYSTLGDANPSNDTLPVYITTKNVNVLYFEDANGYGAPVHPDTIWQIPLVNFLGADRILWMGPTADVNEDGPTLDEMKNVDLVIWNCYDYYPEPQLTTDDTINIKQLVADGGKIWLIGQDIYYSLFSKKGNREKGEPIKIDLKAQPNFLGTVFGLETIYEDYLEEYEMKIMGVDEAASYTIYVESDFEYDGYLYPDSVGPDTSIAHPILIDPDSNFVIGIARNDSLAAFWAADGRGADTSPGGEWENLIAKMLNFFSIPLGTHEVESQPGIKILSTIGQKVSFIYAGTDNGEVTVSDILGRTVKTFKGLNPGSHVSIKDLPAGIYFVKLKGTDIKKKITIVK